MVYGSVNFTAMGIHEDIVRRRKEGTSVSELATEFGLAKSTILKHTKDVVLNDSAKKRLEDKKRNAVKNKTSYTHTAAYVERQGLKRPELELSKAKTFAIGGLGERYAIYVLERAGFQVFVPASIQESCDLVVWNGKRFFRCEVKSSRTDDIGVAHTKYKAYITPVKYSEEDNIDFFIFVQLKDELIFIVPFSEIKGKSFRVSGVGIAKNYINNFDLLR